MRVKFVGGPYDGHQKRVMKPKRRVFKSIVERRPWSGHELLPGARMATWIRVGSYIFDEETRTYRWEES